MVFRLFKRDPRRDTIDSLYGRVAEASRHPRLYLHYGVPDTGEGRFESLTLHVTLVLRQLKRLPEPARDVAQDFVDTTFAQIDSALRESGISDVAVPKRMKKLAHAFYGRAERYDAALDTGSEAELAAALGRNVLGRDEPAPALARYVLAAEDGLKGLALNAILGGAALFPEPALEGVETP